MRINKLELCNEMEQHKFYPIYLDKNGKEIKAGDTIKIHYMDISINDRRNIASVVNDGFMIANVFERDGQLYIVDLHGNQLDSDLWFSEVNMPIEGIEILSLRGKILH